MFFAFLIANRRIPCFDERRLFRYDKTASMAKAMDNCYRRLDGGEGNIIYNKEKARGI